MIGKVLLSLVPPKEKTIDATFARLARARGWLVIKLATVGAYGSSGWPDRLVINEVGKHCYVEFKVPGGKLTRLQQSRQAELISRHCRVFTAYDARAAIVLCEDAFKNGKGRR